MFLKAVRDIAKPQQFAIIDLLKRSTGMSVSEIGRAINMSYMGVKQHCVDLEKKGWLDTWRRPVPNGRPEKLYRLTDKGAALYPEAGNEMTLELLQSAQEIYGHSAPEKLLWNYFTRRADGYLKRLKGHSIAERAASFAKLRNLEGHCADVEYDHTLGLRITEYHSPLKEIAAAWPSVHRMEEQMFSRVLNVPVQRIEERASGLTRISFRIPTVSHVQAAAS
jgi:predicted ArsR family transcriptional regulator